MRILFVSSEVYPFSKTGGLADVAGALPLALAARGHEVLVVSPWYGSLKAEPPPLWIGDIDVPFSGDSSRCGVGTLEQHGVRYAFLGQDSFARPGFYGYDDDARRFCLFTRAVPPIAARLGFRPDVVHTNDWHTAYLPMLLAHGEHLPEGFPGLPSVFTVHNAQHHGNSDIESALYSLRLPLSLRDTHMNYFGSANALQAGLGFAWHVTTVSPSYREEVMTGAYGHGLDGSFRNIAGKFSGILNGLDTDVWNPENDPYLPQAYSRDDLSGKGVAKEELCRRFGLEPHRPLMGIVSRLVAQKGIDLVLNGILPLLENGWNLMVLGAGDAAQEATLHWASSSFPGRVGSYLGLDEGLAHHLYAAADTLAIPSRFEPCGLSQMISMRYGTLPIARATGGLRDTIRHDETGFLFEHATTEGFLWAARMAMHQFHQPQHWAQMMRDAMQEDFSWNRSAAAYETIYRGFAHAR